MRGIFSEIMNEYFGEVKMIEKIMKAVKRGNKKRSINITVGAVVGFLLSCTAVMGAGEIGLEIGNSGSGIEFSKDGTVFIPGKEEGSDKDPYIDNSWDESTKTYTNNSAISEKITDANNIDSCGLSLDITGGGISKIVNKGMINRYAKVSDTFYDAKAYGINISLSQNGNVKMESITNDGLINAETISGSRIYSYGIKVSLESGVTGSIEVDNITNDGLIIGNSRDSSNEPFVYGISIGKSVEVENLINNGLINTYMTGGGSIGTGISVSGKLSELINNGLINETSVESYAITIGYYGGTTDVTNITNNGLISGDLRGYSEYSGIKIENATLSGALKNIGTIKGYNGINNGGYPSGSTVNNLINNGVIYGGAYAIKNSGGTLSNAVNYGILASNSGSGSVVNGLTIVAHDDSSGNLNKIKNYGLAFADTSSGVYKNYDNSSSNFGATYTNIDIAGVNYDIINIGADVNGSTKEITNYKSLGIKDGKLYSDADNTTAGEISGFSPNKHYILNGIEDTLKVIGTDDGNILNNSIINAYKTAVKFDDTAGGKLTLSGTTVNGGAKGSDVVVGGSNSDTLILENASIINGNIDMGAKEDNLFLNSGVIVNGNVKMGAGDDVLNIVSGGRINGTLDGGTNNDVLNFNPAVMRASNNDEIKIFHNISGFENINIGTNITIYEKTIGTDGKTMDDLKISDAKVINIKADGTLTLRIDSTNTAKLDGKDKIIGHALYGNDGTISSEGGKLILALNGAGNESVISFGDTILGSGLNGKTLDATSKLHTVKKEETNEIKVVVRANLPDYLEYQQLNKIYQGIVSVEDLIGNFNVDDDEKLSTFLGYLNDIYAGNPYSYSSELSRKSTGMFRDIVTENQFRADTGKWLIHGGLTHVDGGTKDTYFGKNYYDGLDVGSTDIDADTKITGAYMLGEYGISDTLTSGVVIGGNKLKSDLSNGSKVEGSAMYLGAYAKKYLGNLKVTAGAGFQYGDYDTDRLAVNNVASSIGTPVMKYSDNYNDMTYDIYLNGRYSNPIGDNLFLEPYGTLSYTYVDQDGANEGAKTLAIETDSKSFDYTTAKVGVDLKKVIPHEKGKSTLSAGISYTKILDGADEEHITGRFKGGSDFDILVAHKNEHSIGLNAKYALELENGVIFDIKGTYSVERDSHNGSGKNKTKGEWIVGTGLGYKF